MAEQVARVVVKRDAREGGFGGLQLFLHAGHLLDEQQCGGIRHPQRGPGVQHTCRQRRQPVQHRPHGAPKEQRHPLPRKQTLGAVQVLGRRCVVKRLQLQAVVFVPDAGPDVQAGDFVGILLLQPLPQQLTEEMMIPIPAPVVVQGDDEEVGAIEVGQDLLPGSGGVRYERIAQRAAQPVEDGGAQQEVLDAGGLLLQDLLDQIVQHEAVAAAEGVDEARGVAPSLHRQSRQVQPGDPALGARFQGGDFILREVQAHRIVEKFGGFGGRKAQVGGAQLGESALGAQAGQGQRRILAGGDDQVQPGRQVLQQEGESLVDGTRVDRVVVVQHQDQAVWQGGDVVEHGRQDRLGWRRLRGLERGQRALSHGRGDRLQRRDRDRPENEWGRCPHRPATARRPASLAPRPGGAGKLAGPRAMR